MMNHRLLLIPALALVSSCTGVSVRSEIPERLGRVPGRDPDLGRWLQSAHALVLKGDGRAALETVDQILETNPSHVDSHRLRQEILRQRGRLGLALSEAETRLEEEPDSGWAHYLGGRLAETDAGKREAFARAVAVEPTEYWAWYGRAFSLREEDPVEADRIYADLYARSRGELRTALAYAAHMWRTRRYDDALKVYREIGRRHPGISALGTAETLVRAGKNRQAWRHLVTALRLRPFDPGVHAVILTLLAQGLSQDAVEELLDVLRSDPTQMQSFSDTGPSLLARLFRRVGDNATALQELQKAATPLVPAERRLLRELQLSLGMVSEFLADLRGGSVPEFLEDEGNQVRGRWMTLFTGPWMLAADPLADLGEATELTAALRDVGHLRFADQVATLALLRHGRTTGPLVAHRAEVRREIAFESGLRRILTRGYAQFRTGGELDDLDVTLGRIRRLSQRVLGKDVVGAPPRFALPWVGTMLDSLGSGLPAHLARYNKHLVLGQRFGRPVEGMILTRLSMRLVESVPEVPLPPRCTEVVGENRELQPLDQADLAGIALLNHYVVDMDEVRNWARTIAERRRIAAEDDDVLMTDPLPENSAPMDPAGVEWRLSLLSPVVDNLLESAVLDVIRWHERGHMVDFVHYLPLGRNLWRNVLLVVGHWFDPLAIASEMEGRAELTALAMSPHTRIVLAHISGFLSGEAGQSPHAQGFRGLVGEILAGLDRHGVSESDVRYWHRADSHTMQRVARELLQGIW